MKHLSILLFSLFFFLFSTVFIGKVYAVSCEAAFINLSTSLSGSAIVIGKPVNLHLALSGTGFNGFKLTNTKLAFDQEFVGESGAPKCQTFTTPSLNTNSAQCGGAVACGDNPSYLIVPSLNTTDCPARLLYGPGDRNHPEGEEICRFEKAITLPSINIRASNPEPIQVQTPARISGQTNYNGKVCYAYRYPNGLGTCESACTDTDSNGAFSISVPGQYFPNVGNVVIGLRDNNACFGNPDITSASVEVRLNAQPTPASCGKIGLQCCSAPGPSGSSGSYSCSEGIASKQDSSCMCLVNTGTNVDPGLRIKPIPKCDPATGAITDNGTGVLTVFGCMSPKASDIYSFFFRIAVGIAGGIAFLLIIFGGLKILTSAGNPEAMNEGREIVTASVTGLLLIVFSVFLLQFIGVNVFCIPGFSAGGLQC